MKDAWANVLVSKSEVVSLSILESSAYGLPSLINKNIEVLGLENSVITTNLSLESIKNKIIEISKWSYEKRTLIGKSISETINIKSSIDSISKKYRNFYNSIDYRIEEEYPKKLDFYNLLKSENINFLMVSGSYMFNLMFPSLLIIMFVIVGKFSIAGEIGLVASFWITLTQIFSSNMRSIIISEQKIDYAVMTAYFRIAFSIIFFLIFFQFSNNFFNFENSNLIVLISILILSQWINEMNLVKLELKDNNIKFILITLFNTLITITALILIFYSKIDYLFYLISVYVVYILFESSRNFLESKIIKKNIIQFIFKLNIQTIAFLSSFSIIISSFAWKFMIYFIFNKSIAGIFFACFSIGSFPGTLFNSVIGPAYIKKKMRIPNILKRLFFIFFIILLIFLFYNIIKLNSETEINFLSLEFIYFTTSLSLIGSYFMSYAMYLRHKKIQTSYKERSELFKTDIFYGISITFIIPILYILGELHL